MSKYKIEWCEVARTGTSKEGREWKQTKMSLRDEQGNLHNDVFTFKEVMPGEEIEGAISTNAKYKTKEFKELASPSFIKKTSDIAKAMDKKEKSIERFQDNKDESIKLSAAQRDAVLIVTTIMNTDSQLAEQIDVKQEIIKWRNWFLSDEFKEYPPFS